MARERIPGDAANLPEGRHCSDCFLWLECHEHKVAAAEDERCCFGAARFFAIDPVPPPRLDKMKPGANPCENCIHKARSLALMEWVRRFEKETREAPVGTEDREKGASVYNWRSHFLKEIKRGLGL